MVDFADLSDEQRILRLKTLAREALAAYGMPHGILKPRSYVENAVFELLDESSETHASLRVCRAQWEADDLRREVSWLEALSRETDLRLPVPIPTLAGAPFSVVETTDVPGPRACVLFRWVDGAYASREELTVSRLRDVGRFLARLHEHAETFQLPSELAMNRFDAEALDATDWRANIGRYFTDKGELAPFGKAVDSTVRLMRILGDDAAVAGIIHGDFHQRNYVFDGDRVGALDFETALWGYYVYDLATTLSYLVPEFLGVVNPEPLRTAMLEGYAEIRGLPREHEPMLQIFSAYRMWIMADWLSASRRMLAHDWARQRLDGMPEQIRGLLADV